MYQTYLIVNQIFSRKKFLCISMMYDWSTLAEKMLEMLYDFFI